MFPRGESATIDLGTYPTASITVQIINLSPFPVELDRAGFELNCSGALLKFSYSARLLIGSGEIKSLHMREEISDSAANLVAAPAPRELKAWLSGNIEFNCKVRNFPKRIYALSDIQLKVVNRQQRS
jgi:hypothetical protein